MKYTNDEWVDAVKYLSQVLDKLESQHKDEDDEGDDDDESD